MFRSKIILAALAAIGVSASAQSLNQPIQVGICGGGASGTYIKVAKYIGYILEQGSDRNFNVKVYETAGSKHNLELMQKGVCRIAVIQSDADDWFQRERALASPMALRTVSEVYPESAHLLCHRSLEIEDFDDLVKAAQRGKGVVFVGSENSGGALTFQNLLALRKGFSHINMQNSGPITINGNTLDNTQSVLHLAVENKACAFFVTRAPYSPLEKSPNPSLNLVNFDDSKFDDVKDKDGKHIYSFQKYSKIQDNLYKVLRQMNPTGSWGKGEKDMWALNVQATVVVDQDWESNMTGTLNGQGLSGTAMRFQRALINVAKFKGDFSQVDSLIKSQKSERAPQ